MFAGAGPGAEFTGQQILFQAKANRVEYDYVVPKGWIDATHSPLKDVLAATIYAYIQTHQQSPPPGFTPPPGSTDLVSFPNGTVELKAAWRQLTAAELKSGRFHVAPVRFYRQPNSNSKSRCYQDADNWGLVALHIIQKTPTAPYFIFATLDRPTTSRPRAAMPSATKTATSSRTRPPPHSIPRLPRRTPSRPTPQPPIRSRRCHPPPRMPLHRPIVSTT